ncbi:Insulin-degrading enzyme-like 1, peroxisomal [Sesamum angolense]|uniref:Insulin-degrading enzyme-like 1, peroxisomal n=1 Tax=Sesamum angolense TaxID=2727404 RepID=A0AAE2C0S9_9LAMI|nr:Insulin-degrading enzyme-like 1, peroxisomal [Sesamum angolense]
MAVGGITDEVQIIKPRNDKRDYRRIVLQNNLQVLLISDPETDKCAASMDVRVGSFSDPEGLEGLAHFLEHMLFYASEKYPLEDSYSKYISEHGGSTNAFTSSEHTNYYFDVNPDCFEEAMDRFAQFFIKPLMSADATMREIKAVDSENQKNLLSDVWRMNQLQKHLSVKDHPYHKFSTGNWDTLEVRPKERGMDTREELLRFYNENYSANLMHLVIYTKDGLDKSEILVRSKFQDIRNTDRSCISFTGQPCDSETLQILVKAVPIKRGHKLRFVWPITPEIRHYKEGPSRCVKVETSTILSYALIVEHETFSRKDKSRRQISWATSLSAGESDSTYEFSFFKVVIDLTDAGHEHFEDIVALLFKYINLLQQSGTCKWIFDELAAICETSFHYQDKIRPIDYVVNAAFNMQFYPPEDWLVGSSLPSKFNPEKIQSALKELSPYNVRIFWESTKFEGLTDLTEPWYGTAYSVERLPGSKIEQWIETASNEDLHLPGLNVFIPTDLSLKTVSEQMILPVLLRKTPYSRLWFKPDTTFSTPKAYVKIDFNCPVSGNSPESEVLTDIFTRLLMDYLNEYAYDAQVAGLYYGVTNTNYGFQVTVVGYNHKLKILLETVVHRIANFEVKPDRFAVIKELITKEFQNLKFQQPYQQAMYYCSLILQDQTWPWTDELEVLPHLEAENLVKFYPLMLSRTFLECYAAGNIVPSEAESMIQQIEDIFFKGSNPLSQALFASQYMSNRIIKLEKGINYFYSAEGLNPSDENSALVHYIQVHQDDFRLNVILQLFALIAKQPAFHQLRSVEQLGYITVLMQRNDSGVRGVQFIIQSNVKGPGQIDLRVESFLKMFETKLYDMTSEEFKEVGCLLVCLWTCRWISARIYEMMMDFGVHKGAPGKGLLLAYSDADHVGFKDDRIGDLITWCSKKNKLHLRSTKIYGRNLDFTGEISDGTLKFDRRECEVVELKRVSKKELIDFFNDYIKVGALQKKSLSVRVYGNTHSSEQQADNSQPAESNNVQIEDIFSFRRSRPLYGSFRGGFGHLKLKDTKSADQGQK